MGIAAAALLWPGILTAEDTPKFESSAELERFLFSLEENGVPKSINAAFRIDGQLVTMAAKFGPAYASRIASVIQYPEFRQPYADLAAYLDWFGPCQKEQMKTTEGWWSAYGDPPAGPYCSEVTKLVAANLLWGQVHYCRQLITGEAKPKQPVKNGSGPSWRLDEPPVQTVWLHSEVLYAMADAAIRFQFAESLKNHAEGAEQKVREACLGAAAELEKKPPSRELVALELAKVLVRGFEAIHLRHFEALKAKARPS